MFLRSLRDCFRHLNERPATAAEHAAIDTLARPLLEHHVEPGPGVVETLGMLGSRHQLLLLTKGATEEQQRKIDASELAPHFEHIAHRRGEGRRHLPVVAAVRRARPRENAG